MCTAAQRCVLSGRTTVRMDLPLRAYRRFIAPRYQCKKILQQWVPHLHCAHRSSSSFISSASEARCSPCSVCKGGAAQVFPQAPQKQRFLLAPATCHAPPLAVNPVMPGKFPFSLRRKAGAPQHLAFNWFNGNGDGQTNRRTSAWPALAVVLAVLFPALQLRRRCRQPRLERVSSPLARQLDLIDRPRRASPPIPLRRNAPAITSTTLRLRVDLKRAFAPACRTPVFQRAQPR